MVCAPGFIKEGNTCIVCPAGTFEVENKICQKVGSLFYINETGATAVCSRNAAAVPPRCRPRCRLRR